MSSTNGTNRQITLVNHTQLEQMFPGMPPNTQIRISGPLIPSRFFEEESYSIHPNEPIPDSPILHPAPQIIGNSSIIGTSLLVERKSEDIHFVNNSDGTSSYYSGQASHPVPNPALNTIPEEQKKRPESETIVKSPTRDLSEEEYVRRISALSQLILGTDSQSWAKVCGPNIEIISGGRNGPKSFSLKTTFEINGIIITRISIAHELEDSKSIWSVALTFIKHSKEYFTGNRYHLQYSDKDLQIVIRKSYSGLKALRRCVFCMSVWNSEMSDVCLLCLFSDYFTRENEPHDCPVCKESVRDWTILDCNHRLCYKCLAQIREPRKCPMCRHEIDR